MWTWKRTREFKDFESIFNLVEVEQSESLAIKRCIQETDIYRCYVATHDDTKATIGAFIIATWLPMTKTLHIEDFALSTQIQKQGHAKVLWEAWWDFVIDQEKWIPARNCPMTIEVYLYNVKAWEKILNVSSLFQAPLYYNLKKIQWMGRHLETVAIIDVYHEWLSIQSSERNRQKKSATNLVSKL
jgi:hypothetical protein